MNVKLLVQAGTEWAQPKWWGSWGDSQGDLEGILGGREDYGVLGRARRG